jgi:pre-mRNA-splicing factor ATP-dependent RNA helicase DHX16
VTDGSVAASACWCRQVSEIKPEWLVEIAPHYYSAKDIRDDGKKMPKGRGRSAAGGQ